MASVSSQDILNLANAYACLRQNDDRRSGYKLNDSYGDDILVALSVATKKYTQKIKEANHEND